MEAEHRQQPTLAELARTTLAGAHVATLTSRRGAWDEVGTAIVRVLDQPDGRPVVEVDRESPIVRRLVTRPVATVAVTAPPPFVSLHLTGPVRPEESTYRGLLAYRISLLSLRFVGAGTTSVPLGEYHEASPDPLWRQAAPTLAHLEQAHANDLLACIRAHGLPAVEAVVPRAIDRYGLELTLLTDVGVSTTRLPFPGGPVESLAQVTAGLRAVLTCRCGGSLHLGPND